ncbi:unnamed protein product, partial [marine sediment metagenome]
VISTSIIHLIFFFKKCKDLVVILFYCYLVLGF